MALKTEGLRGTENDSYRLTHCSGALHRSALWKVPRFNMKESCLLIFSVGLKDRRLLVYSLETRLVNTISPLFFCGAKIGRRHPFFFFLSFLFSSLLRGCHFMLSSAMYNALQQLLRTSGALSFTSPEPRFTAADVTPLQRGGWGGGATSLRSSGSNL